MAFTIAQIMEVISPNIIRAAGRRYVLGEPRLLQNRAVYAARLIDPGSERVVPILWSNDDEINADTENKKIAFVHTLVTNAIEAMDFELNPDLQGDPGEDVVNDMEDTA